MRTTRSKRDLRRSHHKLREPSTTVDGDGVMHLKHRASLATGKYRDRQVIDVETRIAKKRAKQVARGKDEQADE